MNEVEQHPLQPFLPENTRILMLGSFPPSRRRWCMDFFYPNFINDMWRIFGIVFFADKEHFVDKDRAVFRREEIVSFLTEKGIALYDTACAVRRTKNTASDKDLEIVTPTDIDALLRRIPSCTAVVTTGQKATDVFTSHFGMRPPKAWERRNLSPSKAATCAFTECRAGSRAYPMKVENKALQYEKMFSELGMNGQSKL